MGCFRDRNRTAPLAPMVSALWGVPSPTAGGSASPAQKLGSGGMLNLFTDLPVKSS